MANTARMAILRAKIDGQVADLILKSNVENVYYNDSTTLASHLATLAAEADVQALQNTVNALGALANKDKVSIDDLETALANLINSKADASALTEEVNRAKAAEEANAGAAAAAKSAADAAQAAADKAQGDVDAVAGRVTTVEGQVTTLIGTDAGKSARTIANEELAKQLVPEGAKESLDTLTEIAAWIQAHPDDVTAINAAIAALQAKVDTGDKTVSAYVTDAIAALQIGDYAKAAELTALAGRVTTAEGNITALQASFNGLGALAAKNQVAETDLDAALAEKVNAASEGNHAHLNKDVLDGITAANVASWNGKAKVYATSETVDLGENEIYVQLI